ncbi:hypothetical protein [Paracnuella aquatica]|uniref:hypothetical protein n=1 Tax=Paracnuella aquatica TaxID=2268757 RepID=UPI000DEF6FDB|nr:hypothetical protein [Paracnuella aquatica]RPD46484.1 hypothetical protein DRJ53_13670 [Paracnuella aquatica]
MILRPAVRNDDTYLAKIIKYIPSEIIAVYTAIAGLLKPNTDYLNYYLWVLILLGVITPVWTYFSVKDNDQPMGLIAVKKAAVFHSIIATVSLAVWIYAIGDELLQHLLCGKVDQGEVCHWYQPVLASILLIIYTGLIVPLLERIILGPPADSNTQVQAQVAAGSIPQS